MITLSIDVTLLDKARFKRVTRKNGKDAVFCDLVMIETLNGKYGDYMVKQSVSKEERASKTEMPILGNGKYFGSRSAKPGATPSTTQQSTELPAEIDEIPF